MPSKEKHHLSCAPLRSNFHTIVAFFWVLKAWGLGPWFQPWPPIDKRRDQKLVNLACEGWCGPVIKMLMNWAVCCVPLYSRAFGKVGEEWFRGLDFLSRDILRGRKNPVDVSMGNCLWPIRKETGRFSISPGWLDSLIINRMLFHDKTWQDWSRGHFLPLSLETTAGFWWTWGSTVTRLVSWSCYRDVEATHNFWYTHLLLEGSHKLDSTENCQDRLYRCYVMTQGFLGHFFFGKPFNPENWQISSRKGFKFL